MEFVVDERVLGKAKAVLGVYGTIRQVIATGSKRKYQVAFDNGKEISCAKNSFQKISSTSSSSQLPQVPVGLPDEDDASEGSNDVWEYGSTMSRESSDDNDDDNSSQTSDSTNQEPLVDADDNIDVGQITMNELLNAHGRFWAPKNGITIDRYVNEAYQKSTKLNFGNVYYNPDGEKDFINYFLLLFPMDFLVKSIIPLTNANLMRDKKQPTHIAEILKFFGLTLTMALDPVRGGLNAYWKSQDTYQNTIFLCRNYLDRFQMSRDRFKDIRKCLSMAEDPHYNNIIGQPDIDPWWPIRPFIEAFNSCRQKCVEPGTILTVDEVMSMWYGLDGNDAVEGLPHLTKIIRKPRGVGAEMKAICDGQSNIMMGLEILEGKERQALKAFNTTHGSSTAVTMRLAYPWRHTGRTIVADSAFSSVKTLSALYNDLGLYFMGIIKTAHREYPKKYMTKWYQNGWDPHPRRAIGSWELLESSLQATNSGENVPIYALGWHDIKLKTIISNRGTTLPGAPSIRYRHRKVIINGEECTQKREKLVPRPHMVELFYKHFSVIDVHDHYRQGSLRMEESWKTKKWWHRIFGTMLGIIFTDCYYAYRYDQIGKYTSPVPYDIFLGTLAQCMISNIYINTQTNNIMIKPNAIHANSHELCALVKHNYFKRFSGTERKARLSCRICSKVVSTYCFTCSDSNATKPKHIYAVCMPTIGKSCYNDHMCAKLVEQKDT